MSTITKELAKLFRKITNSEIDAEGNAHVVLSPADSLLINNARMALSVEGQEPVYQVFDEGGGWFDIEKRDISREKADGNQVRMLYAAPQPVAVPDDDEFEKAFLSWNPDKTGPYVKHQMKFIWNACRAAMLQAGTLTNEGTKQAWTGIPDIDNAINMLDRIDTLDSCDDDRIEAVKTVLRRLAGNSPVIPDGYVMVPKEMTDEIGEAIAMQANCCGGIALDIYDAMIAAAPHDTPALNSVQSVVHVSDGWIPVSERMPEDDDFVYIWPRPDFGVELHIGQYCERNHKGGGWYAQVYEQNYGIEWHPITVTHWMPLPVAPQEVK